MNEPSRRLHLGGERSERLTFTGTPPGDGWDAGTLGRQAGSVKRRHK